MYTWSACKEKQLVVKDSEQCLNRTYYELAMAHWPTSILCHWNDSPDSRGAWGIFQNLLPELSTWFTSIWILVIRYHVCKRPKINNLIDCMYAGPELRGGGHLPEILFSRQDCYFSRQTKIFLTNKTTTDMIFTCYIRHGNFGYSKFTQQDDHYNPLVKQAQIDS
jgi:hypothetical protein